MEQMDVDIVIEEIAKDAAAEVDRVVADGAAKAAKEETTKGSAEGAARRPATILTAFLPQERLALHRSWSPQLSARRLLRINHQHPTPPIKKIP